MGHGTIAASRLSNHEKAPSVGFLCDSDADAARRTASTISASSQKSSGTAAGDSEVRAAAPRPTMLDGDLVEDLEQLFAQARPARPSRENAAQAVLLL